MLILTDCDYGIYGYAHFIKTKTTVMVVDSNNDDCNYVKVFSIVLIEMTVNICMAMIMTMNKFQEKIDDSCWLSKRLKLKNVIFACLKKNDDKRWQL